MAGVGKARGVVSVKDEGLDPSVNEDAAIVERPELGEGIPFLGMTAFRKLYDEGRTDLEIAAVLQVTLLAVQTFRLALKLPPHTRLSTDRRVRSTAIEERDEAYQKFYEMGMIDAEIGRQIGVTRAAVGLWRKGRKLRAHRRTPNSDDFWRYYMRGFTDKEIATQTGAKQATVSHWRYRYDLPAVTRFHAEQQPDGSVIIEGKRAPDYQRWYAMGYNDAEVASQVNRTRAAVLTWRRKHGLDANIGRTRPRPEETHVPVAERPKQQIIVPSMERPTHPVRIQRARDPTNDEGSEERNEEQGE